MLVRCDLIDHRPSDEHGYSHTVNPIGYPNTAAVCGRPECSNPGRVLLKDAEWKLYQNGQRVFEGPNRFTKIQVE